MPLFLNGRVVAGSRRGRFREVELPDGRRVWVPERVLGPAGVRGRVPIESRIRSLMGVPYLWGGRTPMGLDCSALTQIVMSELGFLLPRDADQQFRYSKRLAAAEAPRRGDLIFFGVRPRRADHVGIVLEGAAYVHARGCVRINSIRPDNTLYDNELGNQIIGFGRLGTTPHSAQNRA